MYVSFKCFSRPSRFDKNGRKSVGKEISPFKFTPYVKFLFYTDKHIHWPHNGVVRIEMFTPSSSIRTQRVCCRVAAVRGTLVHKECVP